MTIYANLVQVRSAGTDIVLEFGSFFPDGDQRLPPKDFSARAAGRPVRRSRRAAR
jgi:hypothetical protein